MTFIHYDIIGLPSNSANRETSERYIFWLTKIYNNLMSIVFQIITENE